MSLISQEHKGLAKVHSICAEMNAIWRPTTSSDLGVDGQIEFLEKDGVVSTGKLIAVQVKSGESYFRAEDQHLVKFYPKAKHMSYWKRLILPVILVLHDPLRDLTVYTRIKPLLSGSGPILINKSDVFDVSCRDALLKCYEQDIITVNPEIVLNDFKRIHLELGETFVTGIEFLLGCVDLKREHLELRMSRIQSIIETRTEDDGHFINQQVFEYIFRCVSKCWHYQIVDSFEPEFDHFWYEVKVVPDISIPLTDYGKLVVNRLWIALATYINGVPDPEDYARRVAYFAKSASDKFEINKDFSITSEKST